MVARIKTGKGIRGAINYNERKVMSGDAHLIAAHLYHRHENDLTFSDKLFRLQHLADLNNRVKHRCIHISLNFPPEEILSKEKLVDIAADYMDRLGMASQPYLVYQHDDSGHPHIHIVSTTISPDGKQMHLHNIGRTKSEKARKEVEEKFSLIPAQKNGDHSKEFQFDATEYVAGYGQVETKKYIQSKILVTLDRFAPTSLEELNRSLKRSNITMLEGLPESIMYKAGGLAFSMLNKEGKPAGVQIKASDFHFSPTKKNLQKIFSKNTRRKLAATAYVRNAIELILKKAQNAEQFTELLDKKHIGVHFLQAANGQFFGVQFNSRKHNNLIVKGSDVGREYTAANLLKTFAANQEKAQQSLENDLTIEAAGILQATDYEKGFTEVISQWAGKGMVAVATSDHKDGYDLCFPGKSPGTRIRMSEKMKAYLKVNQYAPAKAQKLNNFLQKLAATTVIDSHIQTTIRGFVSELFAPTYIDPVPSEWLREGKRKKRRKKL